MRRGWKDRSRWRIIRLRWRDTTCSPGTFIRARRCGVRDGESERLACFWFGREAGVLPAFGEFTGCAEIAPISGDRVWVVAGSEVIAMGRGPQ